MPVDRFGLTIKQRLFCENYLSTKNTSKSAIEAGYSKKTAYAIGQENLRKPLISKYLGERMQEAIQKAGVGIDWRLNGLKLVFEACLDGRADKEGCVDAKGAIGAVSEVNKMAGDYAATNSNVKIETTELSEATEIVKESEEEINEIKSY